MAKQRTDAETKYYVDREKWIEHMFEHLDIHHAEFKVLYFIAKRSSYEKLGSFWSVAGIAEKCQCSTKTVSEATGKASKLGYLRVKHTLGKENFYSPLYFWM
jgi:DNA-binding MarR family transcriptional regulator